MTTNNLSAKAAKKAAKRTLKEKPTTPESRLAALEERFAALLDQLKSHGIHLASTEEEEDEQEEDQGE